jgi:hypothetical protein
MTYQQFHRFLIIAVCCGAVVAAVGAASYFGIVLPAGVVIIAIALLWIGWELHRIAQLAVNYMRGYEDGIRQRMEEIESGN